MLKHPKRRGEWVEMQFMARAAAYGVTVAKPWGDSARYDFITEYRGLTIRVQVKSTTFACAGGDYSCNLVSQPGKGYSPREIDLFAFYVLPEDVWYLVPIGSIRARQREVKLNPRRSRNKYFRFLEAWHLLKQRPPRL